MRRFLISMPRIYARIEGHVQGVGYRYYALREAQLLGLAGWVRNLPDGGVEAEAQGPGYLLDRFVELLQHGPGAARVSQVHTSVRAEEKGDHGFQIR